MNDSRPGHGPSHSETPESYAHGHHESVLRSHRWRTLDNSAAHLLSALTPGVSVLDVGCGPGTITVEMARRVAPGRVVGLDASAEVIAQAQASAASEGLTNLEFVVGDAYATGFDDGSFDVVHTHQTLHHVARPAEVLAEMRRVVAPGGIVSAREVDYAGTIIYPLTPGLSAWAALYQRVHRAHGGEPDAGRRLKRWAREAGFAEVASSASVWCFSDDGDRQWWGGMWRDRALESAFAEDALGNGFATIEELREISAAWQQWADDPNGWLLMPHGEVLCRG